MHRFPDVLCSMAGMLSVCGVVYKDILTLNKLAKSIEIKRHRTSAMSLS